MNLKTFFEKFDTFADAPDAVGKMREVALNFAINGQFSDKTSIEWQEKKLGDVIELISGQHLLASQHNDQKRGIPYLTGPSDFGKIHPIPTRWTEQPKVIAQPGDILITVKGSGVGKTNKLIDCPTAISRQLMAIRTKDADPDFIHLVVKQAAKHFQNAKTGIAIPGIGRKEVLELKCALPPLAEQRRIVAKVDELMALCDRLEAQQEERETRHAALARAALARFAEAPTPKNLNFLFHKSYDIPPADLRKSILTLAVQGKLVRQDPRDGSAESQLQENGVDVDRWKATKDQERHVIPEQWIWIRFTGVGQQRLGKMLDAHKNRGHLKPYLRNTNVQWMRFDLRDVKKMRIEEREEEELCLRYGDLLICEGGEPGRCAIWRNEVSEMYFQKALHRLRPCSSVMPEFLALNLQIDCSNQVLSRYFTGATIKHLTGRSLASYPIPLPPLAEQRRIVAKVDELMALVDALEERIGQSRRTGAELLDALVAELTAAG